MNSLFISLDLGTNSSGNIVSSHELEFLKSISNNIIQLGYDEINPIKYGFPGDNPFMVDYLVMNKVAQLDLSNIDIAHFYGGPYTNTIRYLKAKGIKTSCTVAAHQRHESINEFENLGYQYPYLHVKDDRLWKIYSQFTREADIVIVPSTISKRFLIQEGVDKEKIKIIAHGADIPTPDKIKPIPEQFNVGYIGAIGPDKGLKYIIQSWSQLNYDDSTFIFAGPSSKELELFIKKYATNGKFHLMGYVPDVSDFYNRISVYVQPSVTEGFSMEVVEAMSFGRPVIVSDGAGAADCITDGYNGFIVPKRDIGAIAGSIRWFKNHIQELYIMSGRNIEIANKYSWDKIRNMYIEAWTGPLIQTSTRCLPNEKLKIAVCTFYTPDFEHFAKYTTLNIRDYCNKHGYDYIEQTDNFIELSPKYPYIAWNKEVLLKKVLNIKLGDVHKYDWVFWIDSDVSITNKSIRLEDIINIAKDKSPNDNIVDGFSVDSTFFRMSEAAVKAIIQEANRETIAIPLDNKQSQLPTATNETVLGLKPITVSCCLAIDRQTVNNPNNEADIIVTKEESGCCVISAGIVLVRNSEWSRKFIDNWLDKGELPGALWRDQDTFHYFYMGNEEVRKHVKVLKQKVMNSFPQIFSDGDFILHYAGKDRKDLKRLAYYGEKNYVSKRDDIPSLLNRLGLNGEGIEIGVQQGLYAEIILNNSNLKKLHLCDLWIQQDNKIYRSVANVCNDDQNKIFAEVENKFKNNPIYSNRTNLLRMSSNDAVKLFKDCSLDFVYIDANHRYESVLEDIKNWYPKVKAGGIIAGHDYLDGELPEESFGVKSAVVEYFGNEEHSDRISNNRSHVSDTHSSRDSDHCHRISNNRSHVSDTHSSRDSDHCHRISNNCSHVSDRIYVTDEDWPSWYVITKN